METLKGYAIVLSHHIPIFNEAPQANILVDEQQRCVLADFGLSVMAVAETTIMTASSGVVKGSTRWMAPEMYSFGPGVEGEESAEEGSSKEDKTPRDIYAFACTVLEVRRASNLHLSS